MKQLLATSFILLRVLACAQTDQWKDVYSEKAWKDRDAWQRPAELIARLQLKPGGKVADIGCHQGYMSFKLSGAVGANGKVYAVDVEQGKLDKLKEYATRNNVSNVVPVKGDYNNPHLPEGLDAVIILDTYHEMDDYKEILEHVKKALKPGGRLLLCEPIAEARRGKTRSDQEGRHELEMRYAIDDLRSAGFGIIEQSDRFIDREKIKGDKMWIVVASKPDM